MICSHNEISAVLRKAAIGSGFPVGIAVDLAGAGVWLCARGFDGIGAVIEAVTTEFEPEVDWELGNTSLRISDASVARCGPSLFELLVAMEVERVVLKRPDTPLLLIGLAGIVALANETGFALSTEVGPPILVTAESVRCEGDLSLDGVEIVNITEVDRSDDGSLETALLLHTVEVDERHWAAATELAARTYVPATDESRVRGAGAGLSDND